MNLKSKIIYIIRFIAKTDNGRLRFSYIFPLLSSFIGSYIIFMIFSIMNGMGNELEDRVNSFHYKYYYDQDIVINDFRTNKFNKGKTGISYTNISDKEVLLKFFYLSDLNEYVNNKLNKYVIKNKNKLTELDIIIGKDLAQSMQIDLGDSLELFYPSEMNLSTMIIPSELKVVSGIYNIDLLDYDKNVVMGFLNSSNSNTDINYYFDEIDQYDNSYNKNLIISNLVINALKLEKKLYYFFGFLVVVISCFMLFQINIQFLKEKMHQLSLINSMGLNRFKISLIILIYNLSFITIMSIVGLVFTNLTIYLYIEYNIFSFIYNSLPFNIVYIDFINHETFLIILIINFITLLSTIIPIYIINKSAYVKF